MNSCIIKAFCLVFFFLQKKSIYVHLVLVALVAPHILIFKVGF